MSVPNPFRFKVGVISDPVRIARVRWLAVSLILLVSCKSDEFYATVERNCPANKPCFDAIGLIASGGNWRCNGHGGGFYREVHSFEILLPETPPSPKRYEFTQIRLRVDSPFNERAIVIPLTSGHLELDQLQGTVVVDFGTSESAFWANGTYPIRKY
jgi:hypothetical protein